VFRPTEDPPSGLLQLLFIQSRKVNSQKLNFRFTEFSEVGVFRVRRSLPEMAHWSGKKSAWLMTSSKRGATMQVLRKMGGKLLLPESDGARR
jgi:hypothetical protein